MVLGRRTLPERHEQSSTVLEPHRIQAARLRLRPSASEHRDGSPIAGCPAAQLLRTRGTTAGRSGRRDSRQISARYDHADVAQSGNHDRDGGDHAMQEARARCAVRDELALRDKRQNDRRRGMRRRAAHRTGPCQHLSQRCEPHQAGQARVHRIAARATAMRRDRGHELLAAGLENALGSARARQPRPCVRVLQSARPRDGRDAAAKHRLAGSG
ncbi:hypothetical protein AWB65_06930 [Caballeronia humi]|uniref:Uncharacterized protein n=1 Tax=Caballeronia humi TaxID=326474 RepID=A0A158JNW7_9BURK|nr:hypothetical protein AWB65_06930 [Caballeronia humi]